MNTTNKNSITSFTNPQGVYACITPSGVWLSYSIDNSTQVELYFNSLAEALTSIGASDIDEISGFTLFNLHFQAIAA